MGLVLREGPDRSGQGFYNGVDGVIGLAAHFIVRGILDGMSNENGFGARHAQGFCLGGSCVCKFFRSN